jgi:allophanate hydrolase
MHSNIPTTIAELVAAHRNGAITPAQTVARCFQKICNHNDPAIFISLRDEADAIREAEALTARGQTHLPLYGVPVAIKDNIDVAGLATTAACPAFAYQPLQDATVVAKLRAAGAIVIGKTNLDQFATGLVGVRSPYGVPTNAMRSDLVPGGSSSGSAVAVSAGLVPLALGTDTAGSGRVPAMLNNVVGLKPSLGLVSTTGVLPACRTLDCVSIFALTVDDAITALDAISGFDAADAYSLQRPLSATTAFPDRLRLGIPKNGQLKFFGDGVAEKAYADALARFIALGAELIAFDLEPFYETARLLYDGPWVNERYLVLRDLLAANPDAVLPVTRDITLAGTAITSADTFAALYRVQEQRRVSEAAFAAIDAMVLPTAPTAYTTAQVLANPIELNSRLGAYTNFVNLLDMSALAIPAAIRADGIPFGITLLGPGGEDARLASIGRVFHAATGLTMGATGAAQPELAALKTTVQGDEIAIAAVGAHLSGMALNGQLTELSGRLLYKAKTTGDYRLYALDGTVPPKPGLLRVDAGTGSSIDVEVWALSAASFGKFVAAIPAPLSIGTLRLDGGDEVKGFLVEATAVQTARDISSFGGWRAFIAASREA